MSKFLNAFTLVANGAAAGNVLTSDASGNGTWQAPAAAGTADVESFAFFVGS